MKKLGAYIRRNEQGEVVEVNLMSTQITDAGLVHLKALTGLQWLNLGSNKITGEGLVHLQALTGLQTLNLQYAQTTRGGVANLQKVFPDCKIIR